MILAAGCQVHRNLMIIIKYFFENYKKVLDRAPPPAKMKIVFFILFFGEN